MGSILYGVKHSLLIKITFFSFITPEGLNHGNFGT